MPQSNEYMLKQDDAELIYQKKLTAGTNITIDPVTNTISSTGGGGSSVSYAGSLPQGYGDTIGIITIDGVQYPIKTRNLIQGSNINIEQDMSTGNLTISSTAQGTHVEANPSDPATARLSTIEIGSIVYDIHSDNVIIGEQPPSSSQGENGDVYVKINTIETPTENHTCPYYIEYNCCSSFNSNFDTSAKIQGFNSRVYATTLGWIHGAVWNSLTVGHLYKLSIYTSFGSVPSLNDSNELFGAVVQSYNGPIDGDAITGGVAQDGEFAEYDDETYGKFFYQSFHEDAQTGYYSFTFVADTANPICAIYLDKLSAGTSFDVGDWKLEEIELSYEIDKIYYKINGDWIEDTTYDVFEAPETAQDTGVNGLVPAPTYADVQANKVLQADGTWVPQSGGGGGSAIYREVTLYNAPDRTWRDITLADSLLNYDLVLFHVHDTSFNGSDTNHQHEGAIVFTKQELIDIYNDTKNLWLMGYGNTYAMYTLTDYQTLTRDTQVTVFIQRITGVKFGSSQVSPIIYSTEEREVGVWTDNKPLYQKTIYSTTTPSQNNWTTIQLNLPSDAVVKKYEAYYSRSPNRTDFIPQYNPTGNNEWLFGALSNNNFVYKVGSPYVANFLETYITVWYTKTTDTAGSGSYTTLGIPAHHYDGNEKVIGTYFGETLYEKTIHITEASEVATNQYTTEIQSLNADKVFLVNGRVKLGSIANGIWINSPYYNSVNYNTSIGVTNTEITVVATGWNYTEVELTIQYTKTS